MDVVIFRENTEDVYIGIEWKSGSAEAKKLLEFLNHEMLKDGKKQIRWIRRWESSRFRHSARSGWCGERFSMRWSTNGERDDCT